MKTRQKRPGIPLRRVAVLLDAELYAFVLRESQIGRRSLSATVANMVRGYREQLPIAPMAISYPE